MCHGVCASDVMASVHQMSCHVMLKLLLEIGLVALSTFQSHRRALAMCRDIFSFFIYVSHNH